jgi:sirohydrochlorin ferrochelatase
MMPTGIIIVDHGSRSDESNDLVTEVARRFATRFHDDFHIVEPAHMELADPTIGQAFARCVSHGATRVIICPMFLGRGKHWHEDIPELTADAARRFPTVEYWITEPLGADDLLLDLLRKRVFESIGVKVNQPTVLSI